MASIILFWIPAFSKKGGKLHRESGKLYVKAMAVVVLTAAILSIRLLAVGEYYTGLFLGFLSLITANPLFAGWAILRPKEWHQKVYLIIGLTIGLYGLVMVYFATQLPTGNGILFYFFGGIGVFSAWGPLKGFIKKQTVTAAKMPTHVSGMLFSGGAAYTAFFAFGARAYISEIFVGWWQILPWVLPTLLAGLAASLYRRKYLAGS